MTGLADGVERVTGRPAMSVREFVSLHADQFGGRRSQALFDEDSHPGFARPRHHSLSYAQGATGEECPAASQLEIIAHGPTSGDALHGEDMARSGSRYPRLLQLRAAPCSVRVRALTRLDAACKNPRTEAQPREGTVDST